MITFFMVSGARMSMPGPAFAAVVWWISELGPWSICTPPAPFFHVML